MVVSVSGILVSYIPECRFLSVRIFSTGNGSGNVQSLILCSMLIIIGFLTFVVGLLADVIAANRKIMQDVQYKVRKLYYASDACKDNTVNAP